jgi:hypothetical protein
MDNPYKIKNPSDAHPGQLQEEQLISLKDDSIKPPPTVGTPSYMSIIMGPAVGQPGSDVNTFEHSHKSSKGRNWSRLKIILLLLLGPAIGILAYLYF